MPLNNQVWERNPYPSSLTAKSVELRGGVTGGVVSIISMDRQQARNREVVQAHTTHGVHREEKGMNRKRRKKNDHNVSLRVSDRK